jgi:hypothetical protein
MTRHLTDFEIQDILSCVSVNPRIPEEIDACNKENVRSIMTKQLKKVSIYPDNIPQLKQTIADYYIKTQISAGEMVGVLAATSIGEPTTQLALNSFHSSGITKSTMTTGVPRFQSLLNTYKNKDETSGIYLYLKDVDNTDIKQLREVCMTNYEYKLLSDITEEMRIVETSKLSEQKEYIENEFSWQDWHDYYDFMVTTDYKKCGWCIMIKVKTVELFNRKKKISEIATLIEKRNENLYVITSSEEEGIILVYVNTEDVLSPNEILGMKKKSSKKEVNEDDEGIQGLITSENKDYYYVRDIVVPAISNLYICGIKGIEACYYDQSFGAKKEWKIETKGSNFRDVLNHPFTDHTKTVTSNMWEIYEVLGIEAVRAFLIDEFLRIVNVSKRHIIQLVNMMTHFGNVRGANRHGVNGTQVKTLAKITFEEPLKHIKNAAIIGENDYLNNVSSQLMVGKKCKAGTGIVNLVTSVDMLKQTLDNTDEETIEIKEEVKEELNISYNNNLSNISGKSSYASKIGSVTKLSSIKNNKQDIVKNTDQINSNNYEIKRIGGIIRKIYKSQNQQQEQKIIKPVEEKPVNTSVFKNSTEKTSKVSKIKKDTQKEKTSSGGVSSFFKSTQVKSRIFNTDENNLPLIMEKNVDFL